MLALIVAKDKNNGIGFGNALPWTLKDDLVQFKQLTKNNVVIMGRKTYESIGKPLPDRVNIVISRDTNLEIPGVSIVHSLEDAITFCKKAYPNKIWFIIGGGSIYTEAIRFNIEKVIITNVNTELAQCDTYFPELNLDGYYKVYDANYIKNERNEYDFVISEYRIL